MGTWLLDFQFSQQRTVCPKHQVYRTEAEKPVRASSHILQLLFLLPAGVVGVTSGQCVPFKSKENNAGQKPRSTNTLVECHVENSPSSGIQKTLSTDRFDILAVGLWASYSDSD